MNFAQSTVIVTSTETNTSFMWVWLLGLIWALLMIVAMWKIFVKAGEAGWKSIVPFYNTYTLFRIAGRNGWGFLLLLVPFVNVVVAIILMIDLAKHFGKGLAFAIFGLIIFSAIGTLMLGFGDAKYVGVKHA